MDLPGECEVVVVVSANAEWRAIDEMFPQVERHRSALGSWLVAPAGADGREVLFFHGGWGKIAAAASTQFVIHHCRPKLLVNLGTCGGFEGEVRRGDIILVDRAVVYDIQEQMGDHGEHIAHYTTEIDLSWLGSELPTGVLRRPIVSADRDLFAADIPRLKREFGAVVADWESAAISWVAARNGVRLLILRGVSDLVGHEKNDAYDGNFHVFESNAREIMHRLVGELPQWLAKSLPTQDGQS